MKKNRVIVWLLLIVFCCGCSAKSDIEIEGQEMEPAKPTNCIQQIYGADNKVIDELELHCIVGQTNDGIVYRKVTPESTSINKEFEYYHYIFETKEKIKVGSVKKWYQESSESIYIDNHLYLLVTTKETEEEPTALTLFNIDLNNNTMTEVYTEQDQYLYNKMAVAGNRVLMSIERSDGFSLEAYDTRTKEIKKLKKFDFNNDTEIGESIQHISADEDTISVLIRNRQSKSDVTVRVDSYDYDMKFLRSIDLSFLMPDINELPLPVMNFQVTKKHICYQNYFVTSFLGKIKDDSVVELMGNGCEFSKADEVEKDKTTTLYYEMFGHKLYLLNETDGTMNEATFYMEDENYTILNVSRDRNNNYLITMYREMDDAGRYPERLCYIKSTELEFK